MSPVVLLVCLTAVCAAALAVSTAVRARREQRALVTLRPSPLRSPLLVVIPARNEAKRLPATLDLLLREPSAALRVVVVDDGSTDGTAVVVTARAATDPRLSLRRPSWPPATDLFGKPRALDDAIRADLPPHAVVCCLDADVHVQPGVLGGLMAALDGDPHIGALSVMPRLDDVTLAERALVPAFVALSASAAPPTAVHDDARPAAFLNGQLLMVRRAALDDVGGFASVAHTVLEDVALARRLKDHGHRLRLCDGRALVSTRMYEGFSDIIAGFSKNARALHGPRLLRLGLSIVVVAWLPWLCLAAATATADVIDDVVAGACAALGILIAIRNRASLGSSPWLALLSPVVLTVVGVVYARAALARQQAWRGRTFSTR